MKTYLSSISKQLKNYSLSLDKQSILIDKPWALIDEEFEMQKLIFKKNKELILSKNGIVQEGKWDYFPEARSLLIDRKTDKILCNEAFIDTGVMILKLDGTKDRFFILANENKVPDLDAIGYLKRIRYERLNIAEAKLNNGQVLEVHKDYYYAEPSVGQPVTIDAQPVQDGKYQLAKPNTFYEVRNGCIFRILTERKYENPQGQQIIVQQKDSWKVRNGDYAFINGEQVGTEVLNFSKRKNLVVRNGVVVRLERKNSFMRWLSKMWKKLLNDYHD